VSLASDLLKLWRLRNLLRKCPAFRVLLYDFETVKVDEHGSSYRVSVVRMTSASTLDSGDWARWPKEYADQHPELRPWGDPNGICYACDFEIDPRLFD